MGQKGRGDITPERCAERRAEGDRTSCGSKSRVGFKCIISARYTHTPGVVDSMCGTAAEGNKKTWHPHMPGKHDPCSVK